MHMNIHQFARTATPAGCLTLTTEELAVRWGLHPESIKRAVRNGNSPVRPIIPGAGRWVFSLAAIEEAERATVAS